MTSNERNWAVFFAALVATGLAGAAFLAAMGINDDNLRLVLRLSARMAFVVLLIIFVARPLQQMFATAFTARLLRNRRLLGVAFAGIHTAHLGFIIYRARIIDTVVVTMAANLSGAVTYVLILLLFATSFNATAQMLGPRSWRGLHKFGLYWLFAAFTLAQLPDSLDTPAGANWLMLALIAAALVIRLTAYLAQRQRRSPA